LITKFVPFYRTIQENKVRNKLRLFGVFALGVVICVGTSLSTQAQEDEIIIVNQDGEKVKPTKLRIQGAAKGNAQAKGRGGGSGRIGIQNKDGKIIITDSDGKKRELDLQGARSIVVNQSEQVVDNNGERQTKRVGKAIIIGPDGERHEIDLGGDGAGLNFPGFAGLAKSDQSSKGFMIGVHCEPVGDALRSQLQLDSESGLVVVKVSKDSPAEAAGVEKHDILMFADDRELGSQSDLSESVQTAGKEKAKLSLTVIRAGKEIGVDVSPVERPESDLTGMAMPEIFMFDRAGGPGRFNMQFRQLGPGMIVDGKFNQEFEKDFEKQMEDVRKRMDEMQEQMRLRLEGNLENDK
jgi:hypothetical protein